MPGLVLTIDKNRKAAEDVEVHLQMGQGSITNITSVSRKQTLQSMLICVTLKCYEMGNKLPFPTF